MIKKILLLGGSPQQIVAIERAKELGYYTVLCDYLSDNPGQHYADKFYLASTTDKALILDIATKESVDGVVAYASDPAAPTAAYVAQKLGLEGNPYESVEILCNKDKFRSFLKSNGFACPEAYGYADKGSALSESGEWPYPVIIKPVDSSGSKGVTVLYNPSEAEGAIEFAFSFSRGGRIIVEEFIEKKHQYLIGGDIFVIDGVVALWGLLNCHRDNGVNPLVPVGKSYPPAIDSVDLDAVKKTLQNLVDKLAIKFGAMNVELVVDKKGRVFLIDVGPRSGGNMIPDLLSYIFEVDLVEATLKPCMGEKAQITVADKEVCYATHNLHADKNGAFAGIEFSPEIERHIIKKCVYKKVGDEVEYFDNAAKAIGIVFFKFDNATQMKETLDSIDSHIKIKYL